MNYLSIALGLIVTAYEGLALKLLWGWFIAPTFGLPELGFWIALGIIFTIEVATMKTPHIALIHYQVERLNKEDVMKLLFTKIFLGFYAVTLSIVIGFVIHLLA